MFWKQDNPYDCGPCMILNILDYYNIPHNFKSSGDVREKINEQRKLDKLGIREAEGDIGTDDIDKLLKKFDLEPFHDIGSLEMIMSEINNDKFEAIYATAGEHFTTVVKKNNVYMLLDSNKKEEQKIELTEIEKLVNYNITNIRTDGARDRVVIIKKSQIFTAS